MTPTRASSAAPVGRGPADAIDLPRLRAQFPILARRVHGRPLVYLDNAATAHKPLAVLDAVRDFYTTSNANVHRGVHELSLEATRAYEAARARVARFLGAPEADEIIFVRGATEAINLVAQAFARPRLRPGDEILLTHLEHHSNIVPWQLVRDQTGAVLRVAPVTDTGELDLDALERLLGPRTRIVALAHVSNALGTINPVRQVAQLAHDHGAVVVVDGAQAAPHLPINVQELGADFYAITGHKMFAPTGIGALFGRRQWLEEMPPYQGGGEMILSVSFEHTTFHRIPHRFEAGTPNIAGAIGLAAAIDFLEAIGHDAIAAHEAVLRDHGTRVLAEIPGLRLFGTAPDKLAIFSFRLGDLHPHDVGTVLDRLGIAVRTGHHCAQPLMARFGVDATVRASLALYNTTDELDALADGLRRTLEVLG